MNTKEAAERAAATMGITTGDIVQRLFPPEHQHMYEYKMSDCYLFRGCITCGESHLAYSDADMSRLEWHRIREIEEE